MDQYALLRQFAIMPIPKGEKIRHASSVCFPKKTPGVATPGNRRHNVTLFCATPVGTKRLAFPIESSRVRFQIDRAVPRKCVRAARRRFLRRLNQMGSQRCFSRAHCPDVQIVDVRNAATCAK